MIRLGRIVRFAIHHPVECHLRILLSTRSTGGVKRHVKDAQASVNNLHLGVVVLPQLSDYWSSNMIWSLLPGWMCQVTGMSKDRFNIIKGIIALETLDEEANAQSQGRERKVGLWMDLFRGNLISARKVNEMDQNLSLDEQTVSCKSKWTSQTFQNKHKPAGRG